MTRLSKWLYTTWLGWLLSNLVLMIVVLLIWLAVCVPALGAGVAKMGAVK